jgi:hypothetical protein
MRYNFPPTNNTPILKKVMQKFKISQSEQNVNISKGNMELKIYHDIVLTFVQFCVIMCLN